MPARPAGYRDRCDRHPQLAAPTADAGTGAVVAAQVAGVVAVECGHHAIVGKLTDRRGNAALAIADQGQRIARLHAVGGFKRGAAEPPARACTGAGGGRFQQQHGFQLAAVLVQDRHHGGIALGPGLRMRAAAGEGQGEYGSSNGQKAQAHGVR